ncbi:hypothetical protein JDV02_001667 [Purpureocillium takamizusanense]|uniref:LCCL domain-containing protein n=1 Tax=Purpureocillium takamizusanense TaxID=2060973 RepID=A0A9Q8Q779_9HYPO|nr:uncharacterized protein JDV02_001667 [Purpureocillium takamizusanense]UNI15099.1 hypothetical protein JDV02_001667 [Purpureocillium takamizusanense]
MAAPAEKTTKNLSGQWVLNKELSDSAEPGLVIQGIGFLVRKGIGMATITIDVNQYEAPPKAPSTADGTFTHIDIEQSASGLSSTKEARCLDDLQREHSDWLFGNVKGQTAWVSVADIDDEYLGKGWLSEGGDGKNLIRSHVVSQDSGWTATQVWGFQDINGERRYCRKIVIAKDDQRAEFRFVYDYQS